MGEELGGYSAAARAVNAAYGLAGDAAIRRDRLEQWHRRGTLNAAGEPPPEPAVPEVQGAARTEPRVLFRVADWVEWVRPGVPATVYETMPERVARYAAGGAYRAGVD